jgi:ubiquinone/menaquinone biosynthesis C-methylase UbiE
VNEQDSARSWSNRGPHYASSDVHQSVPSLAKLLALARPRPTDICLDLGTGTGHTAAALAARTAKVIGLDVSRGMLQAALELYGEIHNLEFVLAPAQETGLSTGSFDLVTARHTLHHHPDIKATLEEAARLLKPGGRLVIVDEVTPDHTLDAWFDMLERTRDPTHVRSYTMAEWQAVIPGAGLHWIVGDSETRYTLTVESWLGRMNLGREAVEAAYGLFASADDHARKVFAIEYGAGRALRFEMPMALILAVKEPS